MLNGEIEHLRCSCAEVIPTLLALLRSLLTRTAGATKPVAIIATTLRNEATLDSFLAAAPAHGLRVNDVTAASLQIGEATVRFQHHLVLEHCRERIFLHELSIA